MRRLTAEEVHAQKVAELGLDPTAFDLTSAEAIAAGLRRAGTFLCPCSASSLVRAVVRPLRELVCDYEAVQALVEDALEAMIAYGDFLEHRDVEGPPGNGAASLLLYLAPAGFVARESGSVILLGAASGQLLVLPDELAARIDYSGHIRRLAPMAGEDLRAELVQLGLLDIPFERWLRGPSTITPERHQVSLDRILESAQPSRDIPGLVLLDSERPVRYYRGRWTEPRLQSGRFVARRAQAYGAPLWCYVEVRGGNPVRLVDLPVAGSRWRGCDEAWHLQMAIDANRGEPQRFKTRAGLGDRRVVEFFSPVPMWARRRWDAIAEPVPASGSLFAYGLHEAELAEELSFVRETLWLAVVAGSGQ